MLHILKTKMIDYSTLSISILIYMYMYVSEVMMMMMRHAQNES